MFFSDIFMHAPCIAPGSATNSLHVRLCAPSPCFSLELWSLNAVHCSHSWLTWSSLCPYRSYLWSWLFPTLISRAGSPQSPSLWESTCSPWGMFDPIQSIACFLTIYVVIVSPVFIGSHENTASLFDNGLKCSPVAENLLAYPRSWIWSP